MTGNVDLVANWTASAACEIQWEGFDGVTIHPLDRAMDRHFLEHTVLPLMERRESFSPHALRENVASHVSGRDASSQSTSIYPATSTISGTIGCWRSWRNGSSTPRCLQRSTKCPSTPASVTNFRSRPAGNWTVSPFRCMHDHVTGNAAVIVEVVLGEDTQEEMVALHRWRRALPILDHAIATCDRTRVAVGVRARAPGPRSSVL